MSLSLILYGIGSGTVALTLVALGVSWLLGRPSGSVRARFKAFGIATFVGVVVMGIGWFCSLGRGDPMTLRPLLPYLALASLAAIVLLVYRIDTQRRPPTLLATVLLVAAFLVLLVSELA